MCGIVGYSGSRPAADVLVQGLRRLEYRGYDSSGIALFMGNHIEITKSEGRLENVEKILSQKNASTKDLKPSLATCGIGHTRWATHGKPTTQNAHPHQTGHVVLVHNGIIENYLEIKRDLITRGHHPVSETDSELFGFLVLEEMEQNNHLKKGQSRVTLAEAVRKSFQNIKGQCSVVVMSEQEPGVIVGVRNGSPLVVAVDPEGGAVFASDAQPLMQLTQDVVFLEHGDLVVGTPKGLSFYSLEQTGPVDRPSTRIDWSVDKLDRGGFPHYMLKEIHEQPVALIQTLNGLLDRVNNEPFRLAQQPGLEILEKAQELILVACGTSWHAALVGKYWIERLARIPVSVELASEFRYRDPVLRPGAVVLGISQSGETADTLAVLREMKKRGVPTLGISNVRGSSILRESDAVFYTYAGPEIGVAATKTFLAQMLAMYLIAGHLSAIKKIKPVAEVMVAFEQVLRLPHILAQALEPTVDHKDSEMITQIRKTAESFTNIKGFFFIGRGYSYPLALEGALKLKEIAYDYAEGYAAGELKHGPIAMIDAEMVVIVMAPQDLWRDKTVSNLEEVKARGAKIVGVGDADDRDLRSLSDYWIPLPAESKSLSLDLLPFLLTPIVQLLSYYRAVLKGTDVDKPRNLAKSVTVE